MVDIAQYTEYSTPPLDNPPHTYMSIHPVTIFSNVKMVSPEVCYLLRYTLAKQY